MQWISTKIVLELTRVGGEDDPLGIVQGDWIWPYEQMIYAQPRINPGKWDTQTCTGFSGTNGSLNLDQTLW